MLAQEATDATATKEVPTLHQGKKNLASGRSNIGRGPVGPPFLEALGVQLPRP